MSEPSKEALEAVGKLPHHPTQAIDWVPAKAAAFLLDRLLVEARLDELKNHGVEHCAGHSDAPGSCGTCLRIVELERQVGEKP